MKHRTVNVATGQPVTVSGGFGIKAVRVDNLTNQWLQIAGQLSFIRPYTFGEVDVMNGAGAVQIGPSAPPGVIQPATLAGEQYIVSIYEDELPPQVGIPGQIKGDTYVANNAFSYGLGSTGAGSARDIVLAGAASTIIGNAGGVRRMAIKALSTNAASVFVVIVSGVITGSAGGIELPPGDGITIAYQWWTNPAAGGAGQTAPPAGQGWGQVWFVGAAPDAIRCLALCAP